MWQRKQTIYLLLVTICLLALQVLPVLHLNDPINMALAPGASGMQGMPREVYCGLILDPNIHQYAFGWWSLLAVFSVITAIVSFVTIFGYKNRKKQMTSCRISQFLLVLWGVVCALVAYLEVKGSVSVQFALCLPIVSFILLELAHKGIKHDDDLVRSADRIR